MKKCNNFLGYEHFINDTDASKYVVLQKSPGFMSITMVRHDYLLPMKRAGFINRTLLYNRHDGKRIDISEVVNSLLIT